MRRASHFLLGIALIVAGTAVAASHPEWGALANFGILLLLLAGVIAMGVSAVRFLSGNLSAARKFASQKMSGSLVTLSSAAILAVYAAGYHRTGTAEAKFAGQSARRRTPLPVAARVIVPAAIPPAIEIARALPPSPVPRLKTHTPAPSPASLPEGAPAPRLSTVPPVPEVPIAPPEPAPTVVTAPAPNDASVQPSTPPRSTPAAPSTNGLRDGVYLGWGTSRHGDIQASVSIRSGQIIDAHIAQCLTRYPCSWIADLPAEVVTRQSTQVDFVSGATESTYAFTDAVDDAVSKAK